MGTERLDSVLRDLGDLGFSAADLTAKELAAHVHACDRMDDPYSDLNAELCGTPIKVCKGVYFWPLTAGALVWLDEYAGREVVEGQTVIPDCRCFRTPRREVKTRRKWTSSLTTH